MEIWPRESRPTEPGSYGLANAGCKGSVPAREESGLSERTALA